MNLRLPVIASLIAAVVGTSCGGGTAPVGMHPPAPTPIEVHVSAGAPLAGAAVEIIVLDDLTGEKTTRKRSDNGILGTGTTDALGTTTITVPSSAAIVRGPVRVVVHGGAGLSYADPSDSTSRIDVPSALSLTSTVHFSSGSGSTVVVPVTLWTTLADAAAGAYAAGRNPSSSASIALTQAMAVTDAAMAKHISSGWDLRATTPVSLTEAPTQSLRDVVYSALPDIALNQLAREISLSAAVTPGQVITAPTIVRDLVDDLSADGRFDGRGAGGADLRTAGNPAYAYGADTTRRALAAALDHWLALAANKSGLGHADFLNAGVLDAITSDTSILYPPESSTPTDPTDPTHPTDPPKYDSAPPTVLLNVSCVSSDGQTRGPVGAGRYISGSCTITADATDPSGVASLALRLAGKTLTADPDQSTVSHVVAALDAAKLSDGAVQITALSEDKVGNSGTTTVALTVDNTPPAIAIAQPLASAYYSASVPLDMTASDAGSGVASLDAAGYQGLIDQDPSPAHLVATWAVPVGTADGLYEAGSLTACDVVGNCSHQTPALHIDRTPPALSWALAPPVAMGNATVAISVRATDAGAGVSRIWFRAGSNPAAPVSALTGNQWSYDLALKDPGSNTILVWAEDGAVDAAGARPNTGQGARGPFQLSTTVIHDTLPPIATYAGGSYHDERGMMVATDSAGRARVPASYSYASSTPTSIPAAGAEIYKTGTRVSWAMTPTASVLDGDNPDNIPILRFRVPYVSGNDAPVTSARYSVATTCASCGTTPPTATGDLWLSSSAADAIIYDLPLSANLLPGIATLSGAATLAVTLTISDVAGNVGTASPVSVTWHTIGPPVAIVEDTSYGAANAPNASASYKIATGAYQQLFDSQFLAGATFKPDGMVRLVRYLVTNPAPAPVALSVPLGAAAWSIQETWTSSSTAIDTYSYRCQYMTCWRTMLNPMVPPTSESPGAAGYGCIGDVDTSTQTATIMSGFLASSIYQVDAAGHDSIPLSDQIYVPAATAAGPGIVAVYIGRPLTAVRSYQPSLSSLWTPAAQAYEQVIGDVWQISNVTEHICGYEWDRENRENVPIYGVDSTLRGAHYWRTLTAGLDAVTGSVALVTQSTIGTTLVGEPSTMSATTLTRTIAH